MKQISLLTVILITNLLTGNVWAQSPAIVSAAHETSPAELLNFKATVASSRVLLEWDVARNETAYRFEVERTRDGKTFALAGLVFSSEKTDVDHYLFYEKAGHQKHSYRIRIIDRDKKVSYSPLITP